MAERDAWVVRLYGLLLRLLPGEVRRADGMEMRATFAAQWWDARREGRRGRVLGRALAGLPGVIVLEWLDRWLDGAPGVARQRGSGWMDRLWGSVRYGARSLGRSPAFVWSVVLLLGLGIGGVTTIFTLVDHVILRPLPYPAAERLHKLENGSHSGPVWRGLQELRTVESWSAARTETANLTGVGRPEQLRVSSVSEGFFAMFGARPALGRLLVREDFEAVDAVVISEGLWDRAFGRDPEVLGRTLVLDAKPYTVAGVMSGSFTPPEAITSRTVDVWRAIDWSNPDYLDPGFHVMSVAGRLAEGATLAAAQAEVDGLVRRLAEETPEQWRQRDGSLASLPLRALHESTVSTVRQGLGLLMGAVTLLLLVACTNVAHLFMARGLARVREMAVRRALGARTRTLAGQLLVESLLVGVAGAALGIVLGYVGIATFLALSPESIPRAAAVRVDLRILTFAVLVGVSTALVFGMLPALRLVRRESLVAMNGQGRGNSDTRRDRRLRAGLVVAEVALSLVLVVQAGALLRSFVRMTSEDLGFRTQNVWTVPLEPRGIEEPIQWSQRMDRVREALASVPGVRAATYAMTMPLEWTGGSTCCWRTRPPFPGFEEEDLPTHMHVVDAGYFELLDMAMVAGRAWTREEQRMNPAPAVISEPLAIRVFGSANAALGREMRARRDDSSPEFRIIGVVADNRHYGPDREHGAAAYVPTTSLQFPIDRAHFAVLLNGPTEGMSARLRDAIWSLEPDLPIPTIRPLEEWAGEATARARFVATMFVSFGAVALLLVAGGLYGTLLYAVGRRRREIGIRLALGDAPRRLQRNVLWQGLATAVAGCALGAFGAWALARYLQSRIAELETADPVLLAAAVAILAAVAVTASWLPARRAARTDPLEALRAE